MKIIITDYVKDNKGEYVEINNSYKDIEKIEFNHREAKITFVNGNSFDVYLGTYKKVKVEGK